MKIDELKNILEIKGFNNIQIENEIRNLNNLVLMKTYNNLLASKLLISPMTEDLEEIKKLISSNFTQEEIKQTYSVTYESTVKEYLAAIS